MLKNINFEDLQMVPKFHQDVCKIVSDVASEYLFRGHFSPKETPYVNSQKVIFSKRVANILVGNTDLRFILKIHYNDFLGKKLLEKYSGVKESNPDKVDDLFLECCNLLGGRLKKSFEDINLNIGISIPVRTRGLDEFFFDRKDMDDLSHELMWEMSNGEDSFYMAVFIEVVNIVALEEINFEEISTSEEDDVEFF